MKPPRNIVALWAILLSQSLAINVLPSNDANAVAGAIFGDGIEVLTAIFEGTGGSGGLFTDGPFGIGNGGLLTSGLASNTPPGHSNNIEHNSPGSSFCGGSSTYDAAVLTADIFIEPGNDGILVEFIVASSEDDSGVDDPVAIWLDGTQYANDPNGQQISSASDYTQAPIGIRQPNNDMSFFTSSPPLLFSIQASPGPHTVVLAVCDRNDGTSDSGLLVKAQACVDCDQPIIINYVTTTTTVAAGVVMSTTSTIKASGINSGTFIATVQDAADTSTIEAASTTTTEADTTTTTAEPTTTAISIDTDITTSNARTVSTTTAAEPTSSTTTEAYTTATTDDDMSTSAESTAIITTTTITDLELGTANEDTTTTANSEEKMTPTTSEGLFTGTTSTELTTTATTQEPTTTSGTTKATDKTSGAASSASGDSSLSQTTTSVVRGKCKHQRGPRRAPS